MKPAVGIVELSLVMVIVGGLGVGLTYGAMRDQLNEARAGWVQAEKYLFAAQQDIELPFSKCTGEQEIRCTGLMKSSQVVSFKCTTGGCEFLLCADGGSR